MDSNYIGQLFLSVAIFAPGLILLAGLAFVGLLMLLERTLLRDQKVSAPATTSTANLAATANPPPDRIVAGLKDAVANPAADADANKTTALRSNQGGRK